MDGELEILGEQIAEQAAHLDAATHRLLTDLRQFDQRGGWYRQGARSCAHWLSWRVGWDLSTARERVRVAVKLGQFPTIDDALRRGEVSYSKVRAMMRVATPANESLLLDHARLMTASHLEKLCRKYDVVQRHYKGSTQLDDEQRRFVRRRDTDDGMVKIEAVLHPEEAEMVWSMLNHAATKLMGEPMPDREPHADTPAATPDAPVTTSARTDDRSDDRPSDGGAADVSAAPPPEGGASAASSTSGASAASSTSGVSAAPPEGGVSAAPPEGDVSAAPSEGNVSAAPPEGDVSAASPTSGVSAAPLTSTGRPTSILQHRADATKRAFDRADALLSVAQGYLRGDRVDRAPIDITLTIPFDGLRAEPADPLEVGEMGESFIAREAARRIACDAGIVEVVEDEHGTVLSVGRKRRTISGSLKRALRKRDKMCTFPGCTNRLFLEGHHIKHWVDGGETSLSNGLLLCTSHHHYVHEYGFTVELGPDQRPQFRHPHGWLIPAVPAPPAAEELGWPRIRAMNEPLRIDAETIACEWDGSQVNYGRIVHHLLVADGLS